jgi:ATP-dependent Lhr-like helicase
VHPGGGLAFYQYAETDWDAAPLSQAPPPEASLSDATLSPHEGTILDALQTRGALFTQGLTALLDGASPYDALLRLVERGLVRADSFMPIRHWLEREKLQKTTVRQRARARAAMLTAGRWELARPTRARTPEEWLERAFDRAVLLCRETFREIARTLPPPAPASESAGAPHPAPASEPGHEPGPWPWGQALAVLRNWEYTGRVRRGYFISGLSGAQFIRDRDFTEATRALALPDPEPVWLSAADPDQQWGKSLPHMPDRAFLNVAGTAVGLRAGIPVAVFERYGQILRVFEESDPGLAEILRAFSRCYTLRRVFPAQKSLTVKRYPPAASEALAAAGFLRQMSDYLLYPEPL